MSKEIILSILKEYYNQGSDYYYGEEDDYYWALYSNDYPMQHGCGIEIRYYKTTGKIRAYQSEYRYKSAEPYLNRILCQYTN